MNEDFDTPNEEYEYSGLIINGFAMIFFTFVLIPLLIVLCITTGGEQNLWLSAGGSIVLGSFERSLLPQRDHC